jgi:hypothetical protein
MEFCVNLLYLKIHQLTGSQQLSRYKYFDR